MTLSVCLSGSCDVFYTAATEAYVKLVEKVGSRVIIINHTLREYRRSRRYYSRKKQVCGIQFIYKINQLCYSTHVHYYEHNQDKVF